MLKKIILSFAVLSITTLTTPAQTTLKITTTNDAVNLNWEANANKQYRMEYSEDLISWAPYKHPHFGRHAILTESVDSSTASACYFRISEHSEFNVDLTRLLYGKTGTKWTYLVTEESPEGPFSYDETIEVKGPTVFNGQAAFWLEDVALETTWNTYISTNFSQGILELGSYDPDYGTTFFSPHNLIIPSTFTPSVPITGTASETDLGPFNFAVTVTINHAVVTVPAGSFQETIKTMTHISGSGIGAPYTVDMTEWYVLDLGMIKRETILSIPQWGIYDYTERVLQSVEK